MAIHELSFKSVNAISPVSYYNHRIALKGAITPDRLASELGKLATHLRRITKTPVVADTAEFCLLSPYELTSDGNFEILSILAVDITATRYRRQLIQILNQCLCDFFRSRRLRVDAYKHKAYLEKVQISSEIEAQRVVQWNLRIATNNYVFLAIDYSNEYHSLDPLEPSNLSTLAPEQALVHIYDGKTCQYVGISGFTVSEPQTELGNVSLLDYHRRKGEVAEHILNAIPPETPAISVKYASVGNTFIGSHIPQLLKKSFSKDDIESRVFNTQVLSIDDRFKRAIKGIEQLNSSGGLSIPGINITFNTTPYRPEPQRSFAEQRQNNLDFGGGYFCSYPSQALRQRKLLEKPNKIATVVFYPEQDKTKQINFEGLLPTGLHTNGKLPF